MNNLNRLIDMKINVLLDFLGKSLDIEDPEESYIYSEIFTFSLDSGGLIFEIDGKEYMVINFTENEGFLIIPVENE